MTSSRLLATLSHQVHGVRGLGFLAARNVATSVMCDVRWKCADCEMRWVDVSSHPNNSEASDVQGFRYA
jgi:hypothetical protein